VARARSASRGSPAVLAAIAVAWVLAIAAQASGSAKLLHHHALIEGSLPLWTAVLLFVLSWQVMIAAMMLPSSLPLIRLFGAAAANQPQPARSLAAFLGGYASVWTIFGLVAFLSDVALHALVDRLPWLAARQWFIGGGVLILAGAFQFSPLKDACLNKCRLPATFLLRRYRRGVGAAFALGRDHGLFCVGCCWALMLVCFAAGFASLWWMAAMTAVMVYEKTGARGRAVVPLVGGVLLLWGATVIAHPGWLPAFASGS
jgi:predicted metal-binding membrane protein